MTAIVAIFTCITSMAMMAETVTVKLPPHGCAAWEDNFQTLDLDRWTVVSGPAPGSSATNVGSYEIGNVQLARPGVLRLALTQVAGTINGSPAVYSYGGLIRSNQLCRYGTYSWTMKMSSTATCADPECVGEAMSGSVSAGFIYGNNSLTEIDFEFQGQDAGSISLVNWFNQQPQTDPQPSSETLTRYVPFNPIDGFHTYSVVWSRKKISYYIDGKWIVDHVANVPTAPAYFMINQWGTNQKQWGGLATLGITRYMYVTHASYTPPHRGLDRPTM